MMEGEAKVDTLLNHLREFSRYYTGYPRKDQISRVLEFKSERQFVELLHQGQPVAVGFTLKCPWTRRFDRMLENAAAEWYPDIKFVRVECPKYPGFCIARQRKDYPFVEIFHRVVIAGRDSGWGKGELRCTLQRQCDSVKENGILFGQIVLLDFSTYMYNYDMSPFGFREFFKRHKTAIQQQDA